MGKEFGQILDFEFDRAKKLENSLYLEELTGLLARVASRIDEDNRYFFDNEYYLERYEKEPNNSYAHFVKGFKNSIYNGSSQKINIIRGSAGVGKTLFFKKGVQQLMKNESGCNNIYIHMGVDFKNIDNNNKVDYYEEWIYRKLKQNAIDSIHRLGNKVFKEFDVAYEEFGTKYDTPDTLLFPLKFFCERIYGLYRRPCIIVFDNIDLASVETQERVFEAVINICDEFSEFMGANNLQDYYRVYFAMRPETELRYKEGKIGFIINFPLPNILKISLSNIRQILFETAEEYDKDKELSCSVTCQNVIRENGEMIVLNTYKDVADYMYKILEHYLGNVWNDNSHTVERLGTSEDFHCNIVNYNIRIFLRFLSDTISNGGFKPFTKEFNAKYNARYYGVYDYIEMIIRGRWPIHPGNRHMDGEGGNNTPIIYNIFDTGLYHNKKDKVKHFLLNIRILQYFFLRGYDFKIEYGDMKKHLGRFFDEDYVYDATRKLIYVRFIYSYIHGDNIIATISNWEDIKLTDDTKLCLSSVGKFYLEQFICEFEYLYQMAISSLMCQCYVEELQVCWKTEKEKTVLYFLNSIFEIIKENIKGYTSEELVSFTELFYYLDDQKGSRPYRRMLERFISVMQNKVQRAERLDTNNFQKLSIILQEAIKLKNKVENYFETILGE